MLRTWWLVLLLSFCVAIPPVHAEPEYLRATLKGLRAVKVLIESLEPEVERDGLTKSMLQTDVELRLRQSGVRVVSEATDIPGRPYLYINVNALRLSSGSYTYAIELTLNQRVILMRDPSTVSIAPTWWATGKVGMVGSAQFPTAVRNTVKDMVDEFVNAYLAVNPK